MGLPSPHARSRISPAHCRWPLRRVLRDQLVVQRVPGHPGPRLRPALRARLPARPRRRRACRHLPYEARGGRPEGRYLRPSAQSSRQEKWQARGVRRRRPRLAHCGARPRAGRLCRHYLRRRHASWRHDAQPNSKVPFARQRHRRRMWLCGRARRGGSAGPLDKQSRRATFGRLGCHFRGYRRTARARSGPARARRSGGECAYWY